MQQLVNAFFAWLKTVFFINTRSASVRKQRFIENLEVFISQHKEGPERYSHWLPEKMLYALYYGVRGRLTEFYLLPSAKTPKRVSLNELVEIVSNPQDSLTIINESSGLFCLNSNNELQNVQNYEDIFDLMCLVLSSNQILLVFQGKITEKGCDEEIFFIEETLMYIPSNADSTLKLTSKHLNKKTLIRLAATPMWQNAYQNGEAVENVRDINLTEPFVITTDLEVVKFRRKLRIEYKP